MPRGSYHYEWPDDSTVLKKVFSTGEVLEFDVGQLPQSATTYLYRYGVRQALSDPHSGVKDIAEVMKITRERWNALLQGIFRKVAVGGAPRGFALLVKALAKVKGISEEAAKAALEPFVVLEDDDEETAKKKRKVLNRIRKVREIQDAMRELSGKEEDSIESLLAGAALEEDEDEDEREAA